MTVGAWSQACLGSTSWCETWFDLGKLLNLYFTSRLKGKPYNSPEVLDMDQAEVGPFILGERIDLNDSDTLER